MIEIWRTNTNGKDYYENGSSVWIMIAQIIHIRDCGEVSRNFEGDRLVEIITRSHTYVEHYYTTTPFEKIKSDIEKAWDSK